MAQDKRNGLKTVLIAQRYNGMKWCNIYWSNVYVLRNKTCQSIEYRQSANYMHRRAFCFCDLDLDPITFIEEFGLQVQTINLHATNSGPVQGICNMKNYQHIHTLVLLMWLDLDPMAVIYKLDMAIPKITCVPTSSVQITAFQNYSSTDRWMPAKALSCRIYG